MGNNNSSYNYDRLVNQIHRESRKNIDWLNGISRKQTERLKTYLINLDKSLRVDVNSERTNNIHRGVTEIVERISTRIKELDPRFTGTLVPMGSSNNQTRLGDSDEFDFVYELDLNTLLKGRVTVKWEYLSDISLKIDDGADSEMVEHPSTLHEGIEICLNKQKVQSVFRHILLNVLSELELPSGWQHGGFNKPAFSGVREQGPSYVLQFDYMDTGDQVPLCLSVDFVPLIRIPISADENISEFNYFLSQVTETNYCWTSIKVTSDGIYYSHAEELFLNKYSAETTAKTLIRIAKALRIVIPMALTCYPTKDKVQELLLYFKKRSEPEQNLSDVRESNCVKALSGLDDYVTYSDLGETGTDSCILKSYMIKKAVLRLMYADESHGRGWTDDDLPELVLMVYTLIFDCSYRCRPKGGGHYVKPMLSVHLEDLCKTTTLTGSTDSQKRADDVKTIEAKLSTWEPIMARLKSLEFGKQHPVSVASRIAGIFQLFRCVCEVKRTAELVVYDTTPFRAYCLQLIPKKEFVLSDWKSGQNGGNYLNYIQTPQNI